MDPITGFASVLALVDIATGISRKNGLKDRLRLDEFELYVEILKQTATRLTTLHALPETFGMSAALCENRLKRIEKYVRSTDSTKGYKIKTIHLIVSQPIITEGILEFGRSVTLFRDMITEYEYRPKSPCLTIH